MFYFTQKVRTILFLKRKDLTLKNAVLYDCVSDICSLNHYKGVAFNPQLCLHLVNLNCTTNSCSTTKSTC